MGTKVRFKIYMVKKDFLDDSYLKEKIKKRFVEYKVDDQIVYLSESFEKTPKWVTDFLDIPGDRFYNSNTCCFFDKTIMLDGKKYKFVFSIGGADSVFDSSKFVDDFGIKVALNVADKFSSVTKNNISKTMSNSRENATRKDNLESFQIDIENDLLNGVIVSPVKDNGLTSSNISGAMSIGFTVECDIRNLNWLLETLVVKYKEDKYKEKFSFIDKIKCVPKNVGLENKIQEEISNLIKNKDYSKVWFGAPYDTQWESLLYFEVKKSRKIEYYNDLSIDIIAEDFDIADFNDIKKIKVTPYYDNYQGNEIKLTDCLYGEVQIDNHAYVINMNRYYDMNCDYVREINTKYDNLQVFDSLPDRNLNGTENEYNKMVSEKEANYLLLDAKIYKKNSVSFELCDLFDIRNNMFIHVKKYGASSVLSHLFDQALNSAKLFAGGLRNDIIEFYKSAYSVDIPNNDKIYKVGIAIISKEKTKDKGKVQIPFFSKMSLITAYDNLVSLKYDPGLIFIHSTVPLHKKKSEEGDLC